MDQMTHKLTVLDRQKLSMTGVEEVLSFDDTAVTLHTCLGTLTVRGQGLRLLTLSPEGGCVEVEGTIAGLDYEEPGQVGGWLSRLFK